MGESTVKNVDPRLGSLNWATWTNKGGNQALIQRQLTTLLPVQELLPFQRQVFTRRISNLVSQGDQVTFDAVVPDGQAWRLLWMAYAHDDDVPHIITVRVLPRLPQLVTFWPLFRIQVREDIDTPLYPSKATTGTSNNFWTQVGGKPPEFFAGDRISVLDQTAVNQAGDVLEELFFRYEQIPIPVTQAVDEVWTTTTF